MPQQIHVFKENKFSFWQKNCFFWEKISVCLVLSETSILQLTGSHSPQFDSRAPKSISTWNSLVGFTEVTRIELKLPKLPGSRRDKIDSCVSIAMMDGKYHTSSVSLGSTAWICARQLLFIFKLVFYMPSTSFLSRAAPCIFRCAEGTFLERGSWPDTRANKVLICFAVR